MISQNSSSDSAPPTTAAADRATLSRREAIFDAILVRRFNSGDEDAFVEIVTRYREKMFHVAFGLLRNRADAEEIAQDTFIRAHRGLAFFRGDSSLVTWLHRITFNLSRNRYWYFFRRCRHMSLPLDATVREDSTTTISDLVASDIPSAVREVVNSEFAEIVTECTKRLSPRQRDILQLRNDKHHSYQHIGRKLGVSVGTVKSRIARARSSLRRLLTEAYPDFELGSSPLKCLESFQSSGHLKIASA